MSDNTQTMVRVTDPIERISHWLLAGSCLFCLFTGLGLMFRSWDFIPALLGGLYALKWMHIFSGVAFAFALISAYLMWKKDCAFEPDDAKWIVQGGGYLWKTDKLPPVQVQCRPEALLLVRSHLRGTHRAHRAGHVEPHGIPGSRGALVSYALHALSALVIGSFFVVHLYLGTIGNPGTFQAMTTGLCTRAWCKTHCPRWLEDHYKKIEQEP